MNYEILAKLIETKDLETAEFAAKLLAQMLGKSEQGSAIEVAPAAPAAAAPKTFAPPAPALTTEDANVLSALYKEFRIEPYDTYNPAMRKHGYWLGRVFLAYGIDRRSATDREVADKILGKAGKDPTCKNIADAIRTHK